MVTVVAVLKAQPGKEEELGTVLAKLAEGAKGEPGNQRYDLFRAAADPTTFLVYENYVDAAALEAHSASDHFKQASAAMRSLLAGRPDIRRFTE